MTNICPTPSQRAGFSLVEVMISMTIGLVILLAIVSMMSQTSRSQKELDQSSHIVENGSFSLHVLYDDLRLAGYYGHYFNSTQAVPAAFPDPCAVDEASLQNALLMPVQGYQSASWSVRANITTTTCGASLLTNANLNPGSDILVIRRADTAIFSGVPVTNEVYLQSNVFTADIQIGTPAANVPATTADGAAVTILQRNNANTLAADTRKFHVGIYFVAPCSAGTGANGICSANDDTIPTLKRLDLSTDSTTGATALLITPLAEGVEYMKFLYGIDTDTTDVNNTGLIGDGIPDTYIAAPTPAQWNSVMSVQLDLLVRSPVATQGHVDNKSFLLVNTALPAFNDGFRRHVFSSEARLVNLAGPRT